MFISDFAIKRPIITVVVMISLVVFGLAALFRLQTDEFPDIDAADRLRRHRRIPARRPTRSSARSSTASRTASPASAGSTSCAPRRPTASRRSSSCSSSTSRATRRRRTCATPSRPSARSCRSEIIEPIIQRFDPSSQPIVSLALTSPTLTPSQLTEIADKTIGGELRAVPGVAQVNVAGADSATLNVVLDPNRARRGRRRRRPGRAALRAQNLAAPVGSVTGPLTERSIRLEGRLARPRGLRAAHRRAARRRRHPVRPGRDRRDRHRRSGARPRSTTGARRSASTS